MPEATGALCTGPIGKRPDSVLFVCTMNAVRSVMAAGILRHLCGPSVRVDSAGVNAGAYDPLVEGVMDEIGISIAGHRSKTLDDLSGDDYDLIVSLAPEAHHKALGFAHDKNLPVEYWPTMDATAVVGFDEDEQLARGYRQVRDQLFTRIKNRFGVKGSPSV